jgi:hypothetical protein
LLSICQFGFPVVLASAVFSMRDGVTPFIPPTFVAFVVLIIFFGVVGATIHHFESLQHLFREIAMELVGYIPSRTKKANLSHGKSPTERRMAIVRQDLEHRAAAAQQTISTTPSYSTRHAIQRISNQTQRASLLTYNALPRLTQPQLVYSQELSNGLNPYPALAHSKRSQRSRYMGDNSDFLSSFDDRRKPPNILQSSPDTTPHSTSSASADG